MSIRQNTEIALEQQKKGLVFFGTGSVSLQVLQDLSSEYQTEAIIHKSTQVRGKKTTAEVEDWANKNSVTSYGVANKGELIDLFDQIGFTSQFAVLVDFGVLVPTEVIDYFSHGILNAHFSLLPAWRGADPITFALLAGDAIIGTSIMKLDIGLDTGDIVSQRSFKANQNDDQQTRTELLAEHASTQLLQILPKYLSRAIEPTPQNEQSQSSYTRRLLKSDGVMNFNKAAPQLVREINAYATWPRSSCEIDNNKIVITEATASQLQSFSQEPGSYKIIDGRLFMSCGKRTVLEIIRLQPANKKPMLALAFINGYLKKQP